MERTLLEFLETALADRSNAKLLFEIHALSEVQAAALFEATGHDLTGFRRVVDSFAVRHIFKNHGNERTESMRGQIAIVAGDFLLIERAVAKGALVAVELSKLGNVSIVFELETEDFRLILVEEVRARRKELAALTLYKQKARKP